MKKLLDKSERAVLASKDTDKLSTEAPPDEEYLLPSFEKKKCEKMYNFTFGKVKQNSDGKVRFFLRK